MAEKRLIEAAEAYKCLACDRVLLGSKEEVLQHASIPLGSMLPSGLVYHDSRKSSDFYGIVTPLAQVHCGWKGFFSEPDWRHGKETHTYTQKHIHYSAEKNSLEAGLEELNFSEFLEFTKQGQFKFLGEEEFARIEGAYPDMRKKALSETDPAFLLRFDLPNKLVRTFPEIEGLLGSK